MHDHNDFFVPEQVDEQIDQLTRQAHTEDSRFVQDLQRISLDQVEMLDRIETRLFAHIEQVTRTQTTPLTEREQRPHERIHPMLTRTTSGEQNKRRRRALSPLALVAAVIFAILVTGSSFAAFHFAHSRQTQTTTVSHANTHAVPTVAPTLTPTPAPLPDSLCTMNSNAWYAICRTQQQTPIDQTRALGNNQVTLYAGFADNNSVILAYTVHLTGKDASAMPPPVSAVISAQKGVQLTESGATSSGFYDDKSKQLSQIDNKVVLSVPDTITTLQLHLNLSMDPSRTQQASFDFSLPFHRGRTVQINQTQMVNGQPITLDHVSISASRTIVYLAGTQLNDQIVALDPSFRAQGPQTYPYELQIGKWSTHQQTSSVLDATWNQNDDKHQPILGIQLEIDEPLLNKSRDWTLIIHAEAIPNATQDVIFHFKA